MKNYAKNDRPILNVISKNGRFKRFYVCLFGMFVFSLAVYLFSRYNKAFAEFWSRYPGQFIRLIMAKLTSFLPFSLGELMVVLLPASLLLLTYYCIRETKRKNTNSLAKLLVRLITAVLSILIMFSVGFGPSYFRYTISENTGLTNAPVSPQSLYKTAVWLADRIDDVLDDVNFAKGGESRMPYTVNHLVGMVNKAFNGYASSVDYISSFNANVKQIALSEPMTYTHISGVYSFFTGEANVNTNYPDFIIPYTIAHEMSHQRGIAREDEANFTAFLVCIQSDDSYIRYSGYVNILSEVMSALSKADKELYKQFYYDHYAKSVSLEMKAYSSFFDKYRESTASKVVSKTNNAYLSSQKVESGVKSYGLVVNLAVSYVGSLIDNNQS